MSQGIACTSRAHVSHVFDCCERAHVSVACVQMNKGITENQSIINRRINYLWRIVAQFLACGWMSSWRCDAAENVPLAHRHGTHVFVHKHNICHIYISIGRLTSPWNKAILTRQLHAHATQQPTLTENGSAEFVG